MMVNSKFLMCSLIGGCMAFVLAFSVHTSDTINAQVVSDSDAALLIGGSDECGADKLIRCGGSATCRLRRCYEVSGTGDRKATVDPKACGGGFNCNKLPHQTNQCNTVVPPDGDVPPSGTDG